MTASRVDPWRWLAQAVAPAAFAIALAFPAVAQVGAPVQLAPPTPLGPPADADAAPPADPADPTIPSLLAPDLLAPDLLAPSLSSQAEPPTQTSPTQAPSTQPPSTTTSTVSEPSEAGRSTADGAIRIESLDSLAIDTAGTLSARIGGLDTALWHGTPGPIAERLVRLLPAAPDSHGLRDLSRRLLLTAGPVPKDITAPGALLTQRAERLLAMGALDELSALARALPNDFMTPGLARVLAEHAFAVDDDATACALNDRLAGDSSDPFWIKVGVVCDYRTGNMAKVEFGARLLAEVSAADALLVELAQAAVTGNTSAPSALAGAEPVHVALARVASLSIDPDVTAVASLPALVALSTGDASPPFTTQLAAAEKAERAGAIEAEGVTHLYTEVSLQVDTLDTALGVAETDPGPYARAILWRVAEAQTVPVARAQAIAKAFEIAENKTTWHQTARLFGGLLASLQPSPVLDWFTEDAVRGLIAADRHAVAAPWIERLRRLAASGDPAARTAWHRLWPLARIAGGEALATFDAATVDGWWDWLKRDDRRAASSRAAATLALMDRLGAPIGSGAWRGLAAVPTAERYVTPSAAFVLGLRSAATEGRLGETVTLAVAALGEVPLDTVDPMAIAEIVSAMRLVGLERDARRLATEAALAHGL